MRKVTYILLLFFGVITACNQDKSGKLLIPPGELKDILVDLYVVDGYYMMRYDNLMNHNDTCNFYNDIIKQHGYTRAVFDTTLRYYSVNTKKLDAIYDDVITELDKRQQEMSVLQQYEVDSTRNLYKRKTRWSLPKDGEREMVPFNVPVKDMGLYSIIIRLRLFDDDQAENPHLTAFFWYDDKTKNGHREYFPAIQYKRSNRVVVLTSHLRNKDKKVTHIKGYILNHDNKHLGFKKHVEVESIIIAKD